MNAAPTSERRYVGIDLAAQPRNTGIAEIRVGASDRAVASIPPGPADDDHLVALVRGAVRVGVDVALGWPQRFVDAIADHQRFGAWRETEREPLRYRVTDLDAIERGFRPLSVSTDLLGVTALRGALLQARWAEEVWDGVPAPRDGSGPIAETYPGGALRQWGFATRRYKVDADARRPVVAELVDRTRSWLDLDEVVDRCIASDDTLDAVLCALLAIAVDTDCTRPPPSRHLDAARREGWIRLPTVDLDDLRPPPAVARSS